MYNKCQWCSGEFEGMNPKTHIIDNDEGWDNWHFSCWYSHKIDPALKGLHPKAQIRLRQRCEKKIKAWRKIGKTANEIVILFDKFLAEDMPEILKFGTSAALKDIEFKQYLDDPEINK